MSDQTPVSINLNTSAVKTAIPIIADGHLCRARLANVGQTHNDKGDVIVFEYHLLDPAPTRDGTQVKPGLPLFERITLYDKDTPPGQVPERALQRIGKRIDGLLGTGDPDNNKGKLARPEFNAETVASLIGKETFVKVKAKTGEYEGNDVVSTTFPGDLTA